MVTKPFILSSSGLKNIIQKENEFSFIFGERTIKMNNFVAEFLSPAVSRFHLSDPTIESFQFPIPSDSNLGQIENFYDDDIISFFEELSRGFSISITSSQSYKLKFLSIFLGNDELFDKLNDLFPETNFKDALKFLESIEKLNCNEYGVDIYIESFINLVSANFNSIDKNCFKKLPKTVFYKIITNEYLHIEDYDSLFDIIYEIFEGKDSEFINEFYKRIEMIKLSENKFNQLILSLNPNKITTTLWERICERIINKEKEEVEKYLFDGNDKNAFKGIIHHLTEINGGNVHDKGIVSISSSSTCFGIHAKFVADLNNTNQESRLLTNREKNSWIQFDFKERKIQPTHYSIRSIDWSQGDIHPQSWVIEGSNSGSDDWIILDSQNSVDYLDGNLKSHTFQIQCTSKKKDFYRFIRLRQTGPNKKGTDTLSISALDFFGKMI